MECLRLVFSLGMSEEFNVGNPQDPDTADPDDDVVYQLIDISRAHPHCPTDRDIYAQHERDLQIITFSARCPLEIIGNSDTTSNDLNHTSHFTLVRQEIPWGKTLHKGAIAQYA